MDALVHSARVRYNVPVLRKRKATWNAKETCQY